MISALSLLLLWQAAPEMRPVGPAPSYEAQRASSPVRVDGKLDEAAWQSAPAVEFIFPWDAQTGAKQTTKVRLLWDDVNLYAAYECADKDIVALFQQRDDPTYRDDAVELYVNPNPAKRAAYFGLEMNARGVLYDYFMVFAAGQNLQRFNLSGVQLATTIRGTLNKRDDQDEGWTLEVSVPWINFSDLGQVPPAPGSEWAIQLVRWDGVEPARRLSIWSDSAQKAANPHNPNRFGTVRWAAPAAR